MTSPKELNSIFSILANNSNLSFADFVKAKIDEMGITQNYLCKATKIDNTSLNRVLSGKAKSVDVVTLIRLSDFMGVDYRELVQHYIAELKPEEIRKIEAARRAGRILRNFDLDNLKKIGFIKNKSDFEDIEQRILKFFGIDSLVNYEQGMFNLRSLFSKTHKISSDKMLKFWCMTAINELKAINNPFEFNVDQTKSVITRLSILTSDEVNGLLHAIRALYRAGITVLINPYVATTQVRGATFIVNNKPCIVLQDFRKSYDTIWFALAHELCHIIKDLDVIGSLNYHISFDKADNGLFIDEFIENRANAFASEILLPKKKLEFIAGYIDVPGMVKKYAREWQVSESIIYGQYAYNYHTPTYYSKTQKAEVAIRQILVQNIYEKEDIETAIEQVKPFYN